MNKKISLFLITFFTLMCLTACGEPLNVDENTVYVRKNGRIIGAAVEDFDKYYYDAAELETYVNERVGTYLADHDEESIVVDQFLVEGGVARLHIKYAGYEDYAKFNEVEMFTGTVPQALLAGYNFSDAFLKVEDGKLGQSASKDEVTEDQYKVVILSEKIDVKVDGTILYVSEDYTTIKSKDTVSIRLPEDVLDGEELKLTYIIYK